MQRGSAQDWIGKAVVSLCGSLKPAQITVAAVRQINDRINASTSKFTRKNRATAFRAVLRRLEEFGAPRLAGEVVRATSPRPRNITVTDAERMKILTASPPHMRCWLLLCSDLAVRSGTAAALTPENYDPERRELTFTTKYQARQRLPVTSELAEYLDTCKVSNIPFVAQLARGKTAGALGHICPNSLRKRFTAIRKSVGITRRIVPHDLRRTTATRVYGATQDIRLVQALLGHGNMGSTVWYLDHHLEAVSLSHLELAKLPTPTRGVQ